MATKNQLSVSLDPSSQKILKELKQQGRFKDDATIIQEALHSLYRELHREQTHEEPSYIRQSDLNPDDFE